MPILVKPFSLESLKGVAMSSSSRTNFGPGIFRR